MATSFKLDERLDATLEELKGKLGATSKAEVLRKAIGLLNVAVTHTNQDGSVTIVQDKQSETKVILR